QAGELQKIFKDNERTVALRMEEVAAQSLAIEGQSGCAQMASGHKFTLANHWSADGEYVLTRVSHQASLSGDFRSGQVQQMEYANNFSCLPSALPFRPARVTPRPTVQGTQTAVVVGPPGEEIFSDKYSRVKVQFHWDREGKLDSNSSCWVRVATNWAGRQWGIINVPRIGQEVIVGFEEG